MVEQALEQDIGAEEEDVKMRRSKIMLDCCNVSAAKLSMPSRASLLGSSLQF